MTVVTRFAPSPTGFLHIGSARTALFNWLFARHYGGKFLLRIEDTDRARSTQEAIQAILDGMDWLGLHADEPPIFQSHLAARHASVAYELLEKGNAYKCYCTPEELESIRETARSEGRSPKYDGRCRNRQDDTRPFVVRLKSPQTGLTIIKDLVQGEVKVDNEQLDDMVLLRTDGTPTYMLSVVVDDYDMKITHVIRGDDHLTNAFRQTHIYKAMNWSVPAFAHIPLIHGADGAKLSKRHGALGIEAYRDMGLLPEALLNYLLRLGWSHGDDEIIPMLKAIEWFNLESIGKSAARFDFVKLNHINSHYLRETGDKALVKLIQPLLETKLGTALAPLHLERLLKGMPGLKTRAKTLLELADNALFYVHFISLDDKAKAQLTQESVDLLQGFIHILKTKEDWTERALEEAARTFSEEHKVGLGKLAQPARIALTGQAVSPSIFEIMAVLGREESLKRLQGTAK
ncbi:MAG: glutamate--tRNA ligase [Alphaproteobacteria bacterium]|nr:glutamate--tRNA ligase [Alphaproteobacteria bacterium]